MAEHAFRSKVLLRHEQSNHQVAVIEASARPPQNHHDFDEGFFVLEGELTFEVDGERRTARGGDFADQDGVDPPPEARKPYPQTIVVGPPIGER